MKKFQSIGVLLSAITLLLVVLLVSVFTYSAEQAYARREAAARLLKTVDVLRDVYVAEDALRSLQGAMNTALTVPETPRRVKDMIARTHAEADKALSATHASSRVELAGQPLPNRARIREALAVYEATYQEAYRALWLPRAQQPQSINEAWTNAVNQAVLAINLRTRERSMYIADTSAFNNEMAKIIRIIWSMRNTAGHDRREIANAIVLNRRISTRELQDFAEQEGSIKSRWDVIENDKTDLSSFPPELKPLLDKFQETYFGRIHPARRDILDALSQGQAPAVTAYQWLHLTDEGLAAISAISTTSFAITRDHVAASLDQANRELDIALMLMILSISLASFTLFYVILRVIKPLRTITDAMQAVASGKLDHSIPLQGRRDEIGQFARALGLFRDNVIEKRRLEEELRDNQVAKETAEASSRVKSRP
jgi:methyl-accepting chemotaxis protein